MKAIELRDMTLEELMARERELSEELAHMKIQLSIKRLDNPLKVRIARRDLARIKTVIGEKSRAGEEYAAAKPEAAEKE